MGTLVNFIAVIVGGFLGLLLKNKISTRFIEQLTLVLGCAVVIMGVVEIIPTMIIIQDGVISSQNSLLLILALVLGYGTGHAIGLEKAVNAFGNKLEEKFHKEGFAKGFISASLLFCVGAMTISGSILDGLGQPNTLLIKSVMDFISAIVLAATLGYGVLFSSIVVLVYQGTLALLAGLLSNIIPPEMLQTISMVGYAIVIVLGLNLMKIVKIDTANLIPSIIVPVAYYFLMLLF